MQGTLKTQGKWWAVTDLNRGPSGCKPDALTAELTARAFRIYQLETSLSTEKPPIVLKTV